MAAESPHLRRYEPADHAHLLVFLEETFRTMGRRLVPEGKDADMRDLEEIYLKNRGSFHVLEGPDRIRGCIGVRKFSEEVAELKRLYLAPELRGAGWGRVLGEQAIADARRLGYQFLRLDTTVTSHAALGLFRKLGFRPIERYYDISFPDMVFMEKELR